MYIVKSSTFSGGSKMSGSGSTPTKPVPPVPPKSGWISTKSVFVAPTRKGEALPKLADLLKNELFVVLEEGESFSTKAVCSPCGTTVRNCPGKLHGDAFAN